MTPAACATCGYALRRQETRCQTCQSVPLPPTLDRPLAGTWTGMGVAAMALPKGFQLLLSTPRAKRWLIPPLLLTAAAVIGLFLWAQGVVADLAERLRPEEIELPHGEWLESLPSWLAWLRATWHGIASATEWVLGGLISFLLAQPFQFLTLFLIGSLVLWYGASILFEALAGPFLDEIQARVETHWFGVDPRSRLERPRNLPGENAVLLLATLGTAAACVLFAGLVWGAGLSWMWALVAAPAGLLIPCFLDRRYLAWLLWFLRVEFRALIAGLQGAALSLTILILALPLYFVPVVGYFLYAIVTGIATATSLLDIPLERRDWPFRARLRLLWRHLPAWITFGVLAGILLSIPLIGPLLFVPVTSLGGLWLLCRLDKTGLVGPAGSDPLAPGPPGA